MATFNNKIQIARGSLKTKGELAYGELFYDKGSTNLFIGKKNDEGIVKPSRVGGSDGLVLKGVAGTGELPVTKTDEYGLIAGDTYFLTAPIFFKKATNEDGETITGEVVKNPTEEEQKDLIKWEKDSIIIYLGDIEVKNSEVIYNKWLYVNSSFLKADHVLFNTDNVDFLPGMEPDDPATIQKALEYVFHTGMAYAGPVGDPNITYTKPITIDRGQFIYYRGENNPALSINGHEYDIKENSLVICQGDPGKIEIIPLGAASADSIGFEFTTHANYGDTETYDFKSKNADGTEATLTKEADVDTVTKAIDWLNGKKADLGANNKIPLQQIPTTLIGALQFKGTVNIDELVSAVEPGLGKDHITAEELKNYIIAKLKYDSIDEGDYVIFTKTAEGDSTVYVDDKAYNSGDWAIYLPRNPEESPETMDADHWERINASAAVDNVNGVTGSVNIAVSEELGLNVAGQNITISNKTLLDDEANVPAKHVPILDEGKMGTHVVKDSDLAIERKDLGKGLTLTDTKAASGAIDITMKTSGDIVTTPKDTQGTLDVLSKFDAQGSLIDSIVKNENDDVLIGNGKDANVTIKTGTKLGIDVKVGSNTNYFKFEDAPQKDAKGNPVTIDQPATLLDDASIIDCGEW